MIFGVGSLLSLLAFPCFGLNAPYGQRDFVMVILYAWVRRTGGELELFAAVLMP